MQFYKAGLLLASDSTANRSLALPDPLPTAKRGKGTGVLTLSDSFYHPEIFGVTATIHASVCLSKLTVKRVREKTLALAFLVQNVSVRRVQANLVLQA